MKGYKGFSPGLICRGKQYAENTVFEEDSAVICSSGMHFVDGKRIKEDTFYTLKDGKFVEAD